MNTCIAALLLVTAFGVERAPAAESEPPGPLPEVAVTWLGTAGWQVSQGNTVILIDPYLSRIRAPAPPGAPPLPASDARRLWLGRSSGV
jgi:hypothetical protein